MHESASPRVVVTGASGFVGGLAARRLCAAGHTVLGIDPNPPDPGARHQALVSDMLDAAELRRTFADFRPTHVLHAGGVSGPMVLADQPMRVMAINVTAGMNLLEASVAAGVGRCVSCSSMAAVGETRDESVPDAPPMRPTSTYGASKAAFDYILLGLHGRIPMQLCALSLTAVYGPGRRTPLLLTDIVAAAIARRPLAIPALQPWPYIYGEDAADACIGALFAPALRQLRYNIAFPEHVGLQAITDALHAVGLTPRLTIDPTRTHAARAPMNIDAARRDLGFAPRVGIAEGIRRLVEEWPA